ncbi:DUF5110 domain-containing protein [bacterium]|nr:MAG: DUF5110 domain-containing protein [bacterium]
MKLKIGVLALTATLLVSLPTLAQNTQSSPGQVTVGAARFTVVSPLCVRLEYAPNNGFVDAPTLFAINRGARDSAAKITRKGSGVSIETSQLRLSYQPDGKPFNATNLKVTFRGGNKSGSWQPGQSDPENLGGPVSTLDFQNRALNLPPSLISRGGWGLIDDSGRPLLINDWIAPRPGGAPPSTEGDVAKNKDLDWYLFTYGDNYASALQAVGTISGKAAMPRKATLGSWNSRFTRLSADDYRQVVRDYDEHDFPLDVLVMDMDWHTQNATTGHIHANNLGWTGYTWDRKLFPDPQGLLQEFKQKGIFVTLNDHPHDGIRDHEEMYPEFMKKLGQTPAKGNNPLFNAADKHYWDAFYETSHTALEKQGVDFWWLDWQQDYIFPWVPGVPGLRHLQWLNELYFRESEKGGLRGQNYSRWGGWGDQRHPLQFSGDTTSNWQMLAFQVPFTSTSGNGACFYWAHDTGGFFGGTRNAEQYTRWTQFSGFTAALRVHSAGEDRRPWLWGKQGEDAMRTIYHLRSEMFPYLYTSVRECYDDMAPLVRPMYYSYPRDEAAYHAPGQFLFGDNVLIAPIVSPGVGPEHVAKQNVWFPQGSWYNIFSGEEFKGNTQALVTADIGEVPMYARGGVPIPMQPYTARMGSTPISTLRVRCYPGANGQTGTYTLYEDDGRSSQYQRGGFAKTPLSYTRRGNAVTVNIGATVGSYTGQPRSRSIVVELPNTTQAKDATLSDGTATQKCAVAYDAATGTNRISVPERAITRGASISIACAPLDGKIMRQRAIERRVGGIIGKTASGDTNQILASLAGLTPEQQEMVLATMGIGIQKEVDGPNFRDNPKRLTFFAPAGMLDGNSVSIAPRVGIPSQQNVKGGQLVLSNTIVARTVPTVNFRIKGQPFKVAAESGPFYSTDNIAIDADLTVSSTENGYKPQAVIDGNPEGYPNDSNAEWSSNGEKAGASVRLDWKTPQTVNRIVLFDRPNTTDDITGGVLTFSDGSTIEVGSLSNTEGTEVRFPAKTINWVSFKVTSVKGGTINAGLSEFAVFKAR